MSDHDYNPFSGYSNGSTHIARRSASAAGAMASSRAPAGAVATAAAAHRDAGRTPRMQPVDWQTTTLVPGKWRIVDARALERAAAAKTTRRTHVGGKGGAAGGGDTMNGDDDDDDAAAAAPLSDAEAQAWRQTHSITVSDADDCPAPLTRFAQLTMVPHYLQAKLTAQGFAAPTPIQAQAWPILLAGRDLVGVAKTGSGKTLAFIVPALAHIAAQPPLRVGDGPLVVVLAPTRELAQQIDQETRKVLPQVVRCGCIYGGAPKGPQLAMLRGGVHILVATPGRLIDLLEIRRVSLLRATYVVLDEADRMLDMGFEPQVRAICSQIRPDRQTLMFSATWPREIQRLAASFQRNWVRINVGSTELLANTDVTQSFVLTREAEKMDELRKLLQTRRNQRVLVFCKTKRTADHLEHALKRVGVDAMAIHGDKEQRHREFILDRFRRDSRLCLVATDVAARGLDIKELETVVNYDFPMQMDDYVHRIGRTGRAGAKGEAVTFITKREDQLHPQAVWQLIDIVERAQQTVPAWLRTWAEERGGGGGGGGGGRGGGGFVVAKRNRQMMGGFASSRRDAPIMRMPGQYATHTGSTAAPSFDPQGNGANDGYFGLGKRSAPSAAFGSHARSGTASAAAAAPSSSSRIQSMRFDSSDDDVVAAPAAKRARH